MEQICCTTKGQGGQMPGQGVQMPGQGGQMPGQGVQMPGQGGQMARLKVFQLATCHHQLCANFLHFPLLFFSRSRRQFGQGSPKHYSGFSKEAGKQNHGVVFFAVNCTQGQSNGALEPRAQVPFHLRLRNHLNWWEEHSSMEVLTLIISGVTSSLPLPP